MKYRELYHHFDSIVVSNLEVHIALDDLCVNYVCDVYTNPESFNCSRPPRTRLGFIVLSSLCKSHCADDGAIKLRYTYVVATHTQRTTHTLEPVCLMCVFTLTADSFLLCALLFVVRFYDLVRTWTT